MILPPGYVCSFSIRLEQNGEPLGEDDTQWITEMLIHKPNQRADLVNDNLRANLLWFNMNGEERKTHQLPLLQDECSEAENYCTHDVHGDRKVYIEEQEGTLEEFFLILINGASLNDSE